MAKELEVRYLVPKLRAVPLNEKDKQVIVQGYIHESGMTTRVRMVTLPGNESKVSAFLTLKGKSDENGRDEYEYEIPVGDANEILTKYCGDRIINKDRYCVNVNGHLWEVDVFSQNFKGLVIAELELANRNTKYDLPDWVGTDITEDKRYTNKRLSIKQRIPNPRKHSHDE